MHYIITYEYDNHDNELVSMGQQVRKKLYEYWFLFPSRLFIVSFDDKFDSTVTVR